MAQVHRRHQPAPPDPDQPVRAPDGVARDFRGKRPDIGNQIGVGDGGKDRHHDPLHDRRGHAIARAGYFPVKPVGAGDTVTGMDELYKRLDPYDVSEVDIAGVVVDGKVLSTPRDKKSSNIGQSGIIR